MTPCLVTFKQDSIKHPIPIVFFKTRSLCLLINFQQNWNAGNMVSYENRYHIDVDSNHNTTSVKKKELTITLGFKIYSTNLATTSCALPQAEREHGQFASREGVQFVRLAHVDVAGGEGSRHEHKGGDWLPCSRRPEPHPAPSGALWLCLVSLLVRFVCFVPFICPPSSRTSSQFHLPSWAGMASYTHGAGAHVLDTQNFDACVQPNTISFRTRPTTKTTKHSKVYSLIMTRKSLNNHSIPAGWLLSNQSLPKWTSTQRGEI
jgi:hypothetical protein